MIQTQFISFIFFLVALSGCNLSKTPSNQNIIQPTSASQSIPADTEIVLEREECDLTCPIYKVTIFADGTVVYDGQKFVQRTGKIRSSIDKEKLAQLISEIERINYFSLKDKYSPEGECPKVATDYPTAFTFVKLNGRSKTTEHYYGCTGSEAIQDLTRIESKIDQAVNIQQWIK